MILIKPILFNTEMVKAILEGRKTVTRRCVKAKSKNACGFYVTFRKSDNAFMGVYDYDENEMQFDNPQTQPAYLGDILYVREAYCWCSCWDCGMDSEEGCCDKTAEKFYHPDRHEYGCYGYRASFEENEEPFDRWYPSIHMPKKVARIFLKVTDVRVERLQDMGCEDYEKEGLEGDFKELWNSTLKKSDIDIYGWDANPWVWVIEFERCEKPKEWKNEGSEMRA